MKKHYHLRQIIPTYSIFADNLKDAEKVFMELWERKEINYFPDGNPIVQEKDDGQCNWCPEGVK